MASVVANQNSTSRWVWSELRLINPLLDSMLCTSEASGTWCLEQPDQRVGR